MQGPPAENAGAPRPLDAATPAGDLEKARSLARRYGYSFVDLSSYREDVALWKQVPMELVMHYRFVPLREVGAMMTIAIDRPQDYQEFDELERRLGRPIGIEVASRAQIEAILKRNADSSFLLDKASEELKLELTDSADEGTIDPDDQSESPIIKLVHSLLLNAVERRASDIHVETKESEVLLKYRIDGMLYPAMEPIDRMHHSTVVSRLKVMAELDVAERRVPQDGRFKMKAQGRAIDFRVSIMPSIYGEDVVVRILDKEAISEQFSELSLDVLGFPERELRRFRKFICEPYGMVLVTGPTGSGKTTTLYAALSEIASPQEKLVTIEDPVEYRLEHITQVPVNEKKGLSFARGLRSILRHDPDTIMVGEVRDPETAQIAVQAALTGHLVFTTVHANNVFDVIGRFLHMGIEPYNFVSALNCVMAQRLVRRVCEDCRRTATVTAEELERSGLTLEGLKPGQSFYEGAGCRRCDGTGFRGRTAICELMSVSDPLRQMILERRAATELKDTARREGMVPLRESALQKVFDGVATLADVNRVTFVE